MSVGRYFGETSTGIRPKAPNYPRNTIPGKFLRRNSEQRSNSFRRHRFRTTSKVSISKGRSPILARSTLVFSALNRTLLRRNDGAFILLRVGEECSYRTNPRRPRKRVLRRRMVAFKELS